MPHCETLCVILPTEQVKSTSILQSPGLRLLSPHATCQVNGLLRLQKIPSCTIPETKLYALKDVFELVIQVFVIPSLLTDEDPVCVLSKETSCFPRFVDSRLPHPGHTDWVQTL